MALIKCPECGKEISNRSGKCIYCGCPINYLEGIKPVVGKTDTTVENNTNTNAIIEQIERKNKNKKTILIVIISLIILIVILAVSGIFGSSKSSYKSSSSSKSTSSSSYSMSHDTYSLLYLRISNVQVKHSSNYAYITGTISNTGTYQIKFVKVKAVCKDSLGSVVDTDWTYAVDSSWLDPGESKNFEMMVKDESKKITSAVVTILYD